MPDQRAQERMIRLKAKQLREARQLPARATGYPPIGR